MARFESNTDPESQESRAEGHDAFITLMRRLGVESMTPEQRLTWLQKTDAETFLNILSHANGKLVNVGRIQRWTGKATKSVVATGGNTDAADMEPPENAEQEFIAFYERMQKEMNPENMKLWAAKLYTAIIFTHMFPNGNGRTARHTYALLTQAGLPDVTISKKRGAIITELCIRIGIEGILSVFKNHDIEWDREHFATQDGFAFGGNMDYLKYVAAKEILEEDGVTPGKKIALETFTVDQRRKFEKHYADIRKEWFAEVLNVVDDYADWINEQLDEAISDKKKES